MLDNKKIYTQIKEQYIKKLNKANAKIYGIGQDKIAVDTRRLKNTFDKPILKFKDDAITVALGYGSETPVSGVYGDAYKTRERYTDYVVYQEAENPILDAIKYVLIDELDKPLN